MPQVAVTVPLLLLWPETCTQSAETHPDIGSSSLHNMINGFEHLRKLTDLKEPNVASLEANKYDRTKATPTTGSEFLNINNVCVIP